MLTWPPQTIPASASRATTGASRSAGLLFASAREPAVVVMPARSNRSFHATGTPSSRLRGRPARMQLQLHKLIWGSEARGV